MVVVAAASSSLLRLRMADFFLGSGADIAIDARRGQAPRSSTRRSIFGSGSRPIFRVRGLSRLADDKRPGRDYLGGMHLRFGDKRQRDWLVAGVLAAASL